jgi:flagellar biosynthesis protein FlhB
VAARHGVPVLERKQLARAIYRRVDTNSPIPADQYEAVAEALTRARP